MICTLCNKPKDDHYKSPVDGKFYCTDLEDDEREFTMTQPKDTQNEAIIGRQVKLVGDHPWAGHRARVVGLDKLGLRVSLMRNDAMDGHEAYVTKRDQFVAIPKSLETEF